MIATKRILTILAAALVCSLEAVAQTPPPGEEDVDAMLFKDYRPVSAFNVPVTRVEKPAFPVIDMHSHNYARNAEQVEQWIKNMDEAGIRMTMVLNNASSGPFDPIYERYSQYKDRFMIGCSIDYTDYDKPDWTGKAPRTLPRTWLPCSG